MIITKCLICGGLTSSSTLSLSIMNKQKPIYNRNYYLKQINPWHRLAPPISKNIYYVHSTYIYLTIDKSLPRRWYKKNSFWILFIYSTIDASNVTECSKLVPHYINGLGHFLAQNILRNRAAIKMCTIHIYKTPRPQVNPYLDWEKHFM